VVAMTDLVPLFSCTPSTDSIFWDKTVFPFGTKRFERGECLWPKKAKRLRWSGGIVMPEWSASFTPQLKPHDSNIIRQASRAPFLDLL
jgi:hypothetical protein